MRRYTPVTSDYDIGCVKFVIKAYPPCEQFPLGGKMSQYLEALTVGSTIDMRGPVGEFDYHGNGNFLKEHESIGSDECKGPVRLMVVLVEQIKM